MHKTSYLIVAQDNCWNKGIWHMCLYIILFVFCIFWTRIG